MLSAIAQTNTGRTIKVQRAGNDDWRAGYADRSSAYYFTRWQAAPAASIERAAYETARREGETVADLQIIDPQIIGD